MVEYTLDITSEMIQDAHALGREALKAQTFKEFLAHLVDLNATVRGYQVGEIKNLRDHQEAVHHRGSVIWIAPTPEKVEAMLKLAWDNSNSIADPLERAGYLFHALYAIHPFKNGNGRTGRALYYQVNNQDAAFCELVWTKSPLEGFQIFQEIGYTHDLLSAALKTELKHITNNANAESIYIFGCDFTDPWYWRFTTWDRGMPNIYKRLLEEKSDAHLRFPHIVILQVALDAGVVKPENLSVDGRGHLQVSLDPSTLLGMDTFGQKVFDSLREKKNSLVQAFLRDKSKVIASAVRQAPDLNDTFHC